MPAKLENMCPNFEELSKLFGERQNISPSHVFESSEIQFETSSDNNLGVDDCPENSFAQSHMESQLESHLESSPFSFMHEEPTFFDPSEAQDTFVQIAPSPHARTPSSTSAPQSSKKRDFNAAYLESKATEIDFKRMCFEKELELKKEELEVKKQELKISDKLIRKDIVNSLVNNGKTAEEIKAFLQALEL